MILQVNEKALSKRRASEPEEKWPSFHSTPIRSEGDEESEE
jgi:hypothetical protein